MFKTPLTSLILVGLLVSASGWAGASDCKKDSHYPIIDKKDLTALVATKAAFVIDVNSADSFKTGHVPGAIHYGSHEKDFASMLPASKDTTIVAYCGGPQCEAWKSAAEKACGLGYTKVLHFKAGISGWLAGAKPATATDSVQKN